VASRDETNQFYGVRYEYDPETGEPIKQYVPTTVGGKMAGYQDARVSEGLHEPYRASRKRMRHDRGG
jgi:hypothetical protein